MILWEEIVALGNIYHFDANPWKQFHFDGNFKENFHEILLKSFKKNKKILWKLAIFYL